MAAESAGSEPVFLVLWCGALMLAGGERSFGVPVAWVVLLAERLDLPIGDKRRDR